MTVDVRQLAGDTVPHRCRRGRQCEEADTLEVPREGRRPRRVRVGAELERDGLCCSCPRACWWAVHDLLGDVAELQALLTDTMRTPRAQHDPTMPRAVGHGAPRLELDVDADELAHAIAHDATVWAEQLDEALEHQDDDATLGERWDTQWTRDAGNVERVHYATRYLLEHWDELLELPPTTYRPADGRVPDADHATVDERGGGRRWVTRDGTSAACALLELHNRVTAYAGRADATTRYPNPCPGCGRTDVLVRPAPAFTGATTPIRCVRCGRQVTEQELDRWLDLIPARPAAALKPAPAADDTQRHPTWSRRAHTPPQAADDGPNTGGPNSAGSRA